MLPKSLIGPNCLVHRDALFLVGGFDDKSKKVMDTIYKYDPKTGRWVEQPFKLSQPAAYAITLMTVKRRAFY